MSAPPEDFDCRRCGQHISGEPRGRFGWCEQCRERVVRRASAWSVLPAAVVAALYLWLLDGFGMFQSTFVIVWVALGMALVWVAFKISRRVLFDVIRARGGRRAA